MTNLLRNRQKNNDNITVQTTVILKFNSFFTTNNNW